MLHDIVSVSVVNMVTVCALYAHVIAFAAACAEVGAQEARKTQHKATHRKEEKSNILSFLPLLLLFEDGETAEEKRMPSSRSSQNRWSSSSLTMRTCRVVGVVVVVVILIVCRPFITNG